MSATLNAQSTASSFAEEEDNIDVGKVGAAISDAAPATASNILMTELSTQQQLNDLVANDSGRESVNEFDSSVEETQTPATTQQLFKKSRTTEFYASSGSQTKWYLQPETSCIAAENLLKGDVIETFFNDGNMVKMEMEDATDKDILQFQQSQTRKGENCKSFPRTNTANQLSNILAQQIRAVSSPSLSDALLEHKTAEDVSKSISATTTILIQSALTTSVSSSISEESSSVVNQNCAASRDGNFIVPTTQSVGVLQKFKRTLTNFNSKHNTQQNPSATDISTMGVNNVQQQCKGNAAITSTDDSSSGSAVAGSTGGSGRYRFGPLIWRSSKERRKSKTNRRDKCNSGDSGILIELEGNEQYSRVIPLNSKDVGNTSVIVASSQQLSEEETLKIAHAIRRTNSAKVSSTFGAQSTIAETAAANIPSGVFKRADLLNEREAPESLPTRSLSQPNGLETFGICDCDGDSETDSVTSHDDGGSNYCPVYAEVLYNFTAAGPQELGLERGTLIEILRKEVGPWWFGRIKRDEGSLVEEILDPELGWFPKDFVRIIQWPETDAFFLQHVTQMRQDERIKKTKLKRRLLQEAQIIRQMLTPTPAPPAFPPSLMPQTMPPMANAQTNNADIITATTIASVENSNAVLDHNNVTTIIIDSTTVTTDETTITSNNSNAIVASTSTALAPSRNLNLIVGGSDMLRNSAIKELLDTEVNFVNLLASLCEGYLPAMSKRIDIFPPSSIRLIFSNILIVYKFQRKFLDALRRGIEQNQIAKVFLKMHKGFLCYSTYCNSYPRAVVELEKFDRIKEAKIILENCREAENLTELPLVAHLLAPVQRICRYPLHLGELSKIAAKCVSVISCAEVTEKMLQQLEQTDASQIDMPDTKASIEKALDAMKSITEAVNEGKRHSETIARHEASFQNFKGPPLHLHSTRFFLQIDATRQKQNLWNSSYTLFLFDNQLIYCKRDIIKRSQFIYKGRIFLDSCRVVNVRDGKMFGHTIKNSLRLYCEQRDKWYDFSFRSANRKHRFLNTLALERQFGGKSLYVAEMTGFEYTFDERDYSDQSDYDAANEVLDNGVHVAGVATSSSLNMLRCREYAVDGSYNTNINGNVAESAPHSPAKATYRFYSDTLPKKSQSREGNIATGNNGDCQTGSLGRRRLGNWFRKSKSTNATPNQSPTHKASASTSLTVLSQPSGIEYAGNIIPEFGTGTDTTAIPSN